MIEKVLCELGSLCPICNKEEKILGFRTIKDEQYQWRCLDCGAFLTEEQTEEGCIICDSTNLSEKVPVVSQEHYDSVCKAYDNEIALLKEQLKNKKVVSLEDYEIMRKSERVSLERLEEWIENNLDACSNVDASNLVLWAKKEVGKR